MNAPVQILSYGGGVDSFAMLLDAIDRGEPHDARTNVSAPVSLHEWVDGSYREQKRVCPVCGQLPSEQAAETWTRS
jgi:hypothetical protein